MMRWLLRIAVFVGAVALAGLVGMVVPRPLISPQTAEPTREILIVSNPIHTDILLPLGPGVTERFSDLGGDGIRLNDPGAHWLAFGWGSRAFYVETPTWSDLKPAPLFAALTLDNAVMHVSLVGEFSAPQPEVLSFRVSEAAFERLVAAIHASFIRDENGRAVPVAGAAYGDHDAFFEAKGAFNALLGCNAWAARVLRQGGLRTGWWNPLPQSLQLSLKIYN